MQNIINAMADAYEHAKALAIHIRGAEINRIRWNMRYAYEAMLANQWQPIETAPKDGTRIITLVCGFKPTIGWWGENGWTNDQAEATERLIDIADWLVVDDGTSGYSPTHWMPLPPPPKK